MLRENSRSSRVYQYSQRPRDKANKLDTARRQVLPWGLKKTQVASCETASDYGKFQTYRKVENTIASDHVPASFTACGYLLYLCPFFPPEFLQLKLNSHCLVK